MTTEKPLRLWPGVAAAAVLVIGRLVLPAVLPDLALAGLMASMVATLAILVWWLFLSRAPGKERLGIFVLLTAALAATYPLLHVSIAGGGMGMLFVMYGPSSAALALVLGVVAARRMPATARRVVVAAAVIIGAGLWTLLRTGGVANNLLGSDFHLRWTPTPEQRLLAQTQHETLPAPPTAARIEPRSVERPGGEPAASPEPIEPAETEPAEPMERVEPLEPVAWPGFRGPLRNGAIPGLRIASDWTASPPAAVWRKPIGPGWSSFAVQGDLLYTQEQRGEQEIVSCYKVSTGEAVWRHGDPVRFYESNGGAGPRATPTLSGGRLYSLGATGIVNALNARTGAVIWTRNVSADTKVETPGWGFAASPLVTGDLVIVAASGALAAYERGTGTLRWMMASTGGGYSSPHLMTIDGVTQVVFLSAGGAVGVNPDDGTELWRRTLDGSAIVQPAIMPDGSLLVSGNGMTGGNNMQRIAPKQRDGKWMVEDRWTSNGLKPYFNDYVVHEGHAYGFDGNILASIDLSDGKRKWKGGRYGNGQMVLLPDQDLLLVLSEDGELVLVSATPDKFTEIAKVPALEGKTWNHPVVTGDLLLVRNGQEMAAFRLSVR